jgi:hypothetical protein
MGSPPELEVVSLQNAYMVTLQWRQILQNLAVSINNFEPVNNV